ncbi:hypothetical protein GCM10025869_17480 [Homoserinibacter gongjuensis]|uniref:STAS domain-containing protein n=1 Tax=Homoserinibacter gongjuensis TaxID=1162968 RepID=A0ABQ6JVT4_9MICO|nr:hypothetical protein GCM10025869_17480 [Homoserinibacter gongjuensis]
MAARHDAEVDVLVGAEVGVDHGLLLHDRLGRPLGHDPTLGHHDDPVGDVPHHVHVVFDEHDSHAEVLQVEDVVEQRLREGGVHARHRLVEHDELRVAHEGARHLEQLALAARERGGEVLLLGVELEARQELARLLLDRGLLPAPQEGQEAGPDALAGLLRRAELHVLEHREQAE